MPAADVAPNGNPLNTDPARWDEDGYCVFPSLFSPSHVRMSVRHCGASRENNRL